VLNECEDALRLIKCTWHQRKMLQCNCSSLH